MAGLFGLQINIKGINWQNISDINQPQNINSVLLRLPNVLHQQIDPQQQDAQNTQGKSHHSMPELDIIPIGLNT